MHYTPRTIGFVCELVHPVLPLDAAALQRLHARLYESREPLYRNFSVAPDAIALSSPCPRPNAASSVEFRSERIVFREDLTGISVDEFAARVVAIVEQSGRAVSTFLAQQVTVRTLVNPRHFDDSRAFLKHGMFGFDEEEAAAFGREPELYGLRLVLPSADGLPGLHALRIESCAADPRSLYIEDQATFPPFAAARGLASVRANVERAYRFATERAVRFVSRFDARQKA